MPRRAQIKCINKEPRNDPFTRISHVGGFVQSQWKLPIDDAIAKIEKREWEFYVEVDRDRVDVVIAVGPSGRKYLRTVADGDLPNNLLSLPECP